MPALVVQRVVRQPVMLKARCGRRDRVLGVVQMKARYADVVQALVVRIARRAGRDPVLRVVLPNARCAGRDRVLGVMVTERSL